MDTKFGAFANRQQNGMLVVLWPNTVHDAVRLQDILLAEHLLSFLMFRVCAQNGAPNGLAALLGVAAGR